VKLLRIRLKKSKRQPPTAVRDALGAVIALSPEAAQVNTERRRESDEAGTEGRQAIAQRRRAVYEEVNSYNTAVFGYLGRAALRPLYFRAYASGCPTGAPLTRAISAASNSIEFN
jgi:hypothetical protein